jgi:hypothetical protein
MAEPLPEGMGFSDTAFRIFLLMASRRLKSDRFLSQDYRPEIYTKQGIDRVEKNSMKSVISRHFPTVVFAMDGIEDDNAFNRGKPGREEARTLRTGHDVSNGASEHSYAVAARAPERCRNRAWG